MSEARATNPLVDQFRKGGVPKELRLMAAQGALPLKPEDLVELLHRPHRDTRRGGAGGGRGSPWPSFPPPSSLPILEEPRDAAQVLAWAVDHPRGEELREVVLQNTSLPDEARGLAASCPRSWPSSWSSTRRASCAAPRLLEALETNPSLNNDQQRRLRELRETFRIGEQPSRRGPAAPAAAAAPAAESPPEPESVEDAPLTEDEALVRYLSDEERQQTEKVSAVQKLYRLTPPRR